MFSWVLCLRSSVKVSQSVGEVGPLSTDSGRLHFQPIQVNSLDLCWRSEVSVSLLVVRFGRGTDYLLTEAIRFPSHLPSFVFIPATLHQVFPCSNLSGFSCCHVRGHLIDQTHQDNLPVLRSTCRITQHSHRSDIKLVFTDFSNQFRASLGDHFSTSFAAVEKQDGRALIYFEVF